MPKFVAFGRPEVLCRSSHVPFWGGPLSLIDAIGHTALIINSSPPKKRCKVSLGEAFDILWRWLVQCRFSNDQYSWYGTKNCLLWSVGSEFHCAVCRPKHDLSVCLREIFQVVCGSSLSFPFCLSLGKPWLESLPSNLSPSLPGVLG